ncbi:DUF3553 domain-containing protein [Amycolatopsis tolypomycina]|uniref:DUF3553 domain-containing protein n=1 Tax=Amycolatopsis tolypomycina TaxID=208445 RepID=UPI000A71E53F
MAATLAGHGTPLKPAELGRKLGVSAAQRTRAVNLLEQAGAVGVTSDGRLEYLDPRLAPETAVDRSMEIAETHQRLIRSRIEMMRGYAETTGCRRQNLLGYFGEQLPRPCGNCDTCAAGTAGTAAEQASGTSEFPVNGAVRHADWGDGVVMSVDDDKVTVVFDEHGYKTLSVPAVRENSVLEVTAERPA